jgi:hypothetical protein
VGCYRVGGLCSTLATIIFLLISLTQANQWDFARTGLAGKREDGKDFLNEVHSESPLYHSIGYLGTGL